MPKRKRKSEPLHVIKQSTIRDAGNGAFAAKNIAAGTLLGEYKGKKVSKKAFESAKDTTYMFQISYKGRPQHYIEGNEDCWLRYINGAKGKQQRSKINVKSYQYRKKIWYRTTRAVNKGEEFIMDYGDNFW